MPSHETELKLHLPEGAAESLSLAATLKGLSPRTARLHAIYFDTADRLLQRQRMALRLRRSGRQWVQTLKTSDASTGGLSTRPEWESPARVVRGQPRIDLKRLQHTPLPRLLAKHAASGLLRPVFTTRVLRTVWNVNFKSSRIEVAMDRGRIESPREGRRVTEPISELELELLEGQVEDLIALALRLAGRGSEALALVPLTASKAERGYRLAAGLAPPPTKAAARGFIDALKADMTFGAALRAIIAQGLGVMLANTAALRDGHDPEYVHQARVALRRMRSAVRLLDRSHADFPAALANDLRWAGRLLGDARDGDVLAGETLPAFAAAAPPELGSRVQLLLDHACTRRDAARTAATAALATPRYARLALRLQAWTLTPPPAGRTLARLAPRVLGRAHARLFAAAQFFAALSPERRHRVRILAKRLRYGLDVFSVALPPKPTERCIAALSGLQDVLGELNDAVVARSVLREITDSEVIHAAVTQWASAREQDRVREAEVRLLALLQTGRPWKD
jgi:triphosphatase